MPHIEHEQAFWLQATATGSQLLVSSDHACAGFTWYAAMQPNQAKGTKALTLGHAALHITLLQRDG